MLWLAVRPLRMGAARAFRDTYPPRGYNALISTTLSRTLYQVGGSRCICTAVSSILPKGERYWWVPQDKQYKGLFLVFYLSCAPVKECYGKTCGSRCVRACRQTVQPFFLTPVGWAARRLVKEWAGEARRAWTTKPEPFQAHGSFTCRHERLVLRRLARTL